MRVGTAIAGIVVAMVVAASGAKAADPDPTQYCVGDGGPLGAATAAEHNVLVGDPRLPPGVRQRRITVDGVSTRITESGPRHAKEAVLFVHGNPTSARDWDDLVAANGRFARTVALDIPGYGKSDKLSTSIQTLNGAAGYIDGVRRALGISRVVLVAHDFGGIWGLQWASQQPKSLIGVVLIDTGVLKDYVPHPLALVWATPGAGELQVASTTRQSFHQAINYMQPRPLPNRFVDRVYDDYDRLTRCAQLRYYRSVRDATSGNLNAIADKQAAALRRRKRPALVIWGAHDPYIPVAQAYKQRDVFPGARVAVFQDSAHWPFVDNAAKTRSLVARFLRPRLSARLGRASSGRVSVRVKVSGSLPAYRLTVSLGRASVSVHSLSGARTITIQLARPLTAGVRHLTVRALGLPVVRLKLRVARGLHRRSPHHAQATPDGR